MNRSFLFILCCISSLASTQTVRYSISFPNAVHHEAEVTVTWTNITTPVLQARMSRSSPGRYALHEFAKNVYNVRAVDEKGAILSITRPNPYQWDVSGHHGTVVLSYTIFGDRIDGTYLAVDRTHAHINMPATFMWARGMDDRPIELSITLPPHSDWKAATQLQRTKKSMTFTAPNLQYFMDSPTELSDFQQRHWIDSSESVHAAFTIDLHGDSAPKYLDAYETMVKAILAEHLAMWGRYAPYDYGEYTFIADYLPYAHGDGMEHRNSTILTSTLSLEDNSVRLVDALSHEFFHSWNVERIRPASLEPFDFERANMSGELWFAEGFTSYYGPLLVHRAGITSIDDYAKTLSRLLNGVCNAPGLKYFSAVDMSRYAPFADAATSIDVTNAANTFISYYNIGAAIGLGLDLTIRTTFPGKSLDDMMRAMRDAHPDVDRPYTLNDLEQTLGSVVNDREFAEKFFAHYVEGKELIDYAPLLFRAGFVLQKADSGKASLGYAPMKFQKGKAVLISGTRAGSPLYNAGLDRDDTIMTIDGKKFSSEAEVDTILIKHAPDDKVSIEFMQRGERREGTITLEESRKLEVVPIETKGIDISPSVEAFRRSWLGKKSTEQFPTLVKYCPKCERSYPFNTSYCPLDGNELSIVR